MSNIGAVAAIEPASTRAQERLAIALAAVAGLVDGVGFLVLFMEFTAQMSGNTVQIGVGVGRAHWGAALFRLVPVPQFVLGIVIGLLVSEWARRRSIRSRVAVVVSLELVLLVVFVVLAWPRITGGSVHVGSRWALYGLIGCLTIAMGLQTAALQRVGGRSVRTTYISGMLTDLGSEAAHLIAGARWGRTRHQETVGEGAGAHEALQSRRLRSIGFLGSIWLAYAAGAALGGLMELHWSLGALVPAMVALAVVVLVDLARPLSSQPSAS